jgi:hypothetical protein
MVTAKTTAMARIDLRIKGIPGSVVGNAECRWQMLIVRIYKSNPGLTPPPTERGKNPGLLAATA